MSGVIALSIIGLSAYLVVGIFVARAVNKNFEDFTFWKGVLIVLFWPLIPVLFIVAILGWIGRGSH